MRAFLDLLYRASGFAAALAMIATLVMVSAGIISRPLGVYLRGTDDYAGYAMAACGFLALAYTFKHGEHIRVSLLIERLDGRTRRIAEWLALVAAALVSGTLAAYAVRLVIQSHEFGDVSASVDATPLWIPQIPMAIGSLILFIAILDDLVCVSRGVPVSRLAQPDAEASHLE